MWGRAAAVLCASVSLLAGCNDQSSGGQPFAAPTAAEIANDSADRVPDPAPPSAAPTTATVRALLPEPQASRTPPCPASDAWGKDPLGPGIRVTIWSDHADKVPVLIRTNFGQDRARSGVIGAQDRFRMFAFPDVDHTAVVEVLILSETESCSAQLDPATAGG